MPDAPLVLLLKTPKPPGVMVKLPDVPAPAGAAKLWKVTPFTVVLGTATSPTLNAPSKVPVVLTLLFPLICCCAFQVIFAACANGETRRSAGMMRTRARGERSG